MTAAVSGHCRHCLADLVRLATWFDESDPDQAAALWAAAFGLYPCRHLGFVADPDGDPRATR